MASRQWHRLSPAEAVRELASDETRGLDPTEAARRLSQRGPNELRRTRSRSPLALFLDQFKDVMVLVLLGATAVSYALGEVADTLAILVIVTVNAVLGFIQEYRAEWKPRWGASPA